MKELSENIFTRHYNPELVKIWIGLEFAGGQVGVPILLATLCFSRLRRLPTLYSLLVTWIASGFICCLLFYTDHDLPNDPQPSYALCLMQAAFIYGVPPMTAMSAFALVYEGWITISGQALPTGKNGLQIRTAFLVMIPWLGMLFTAIATFAVGYADPASVSRDRRIFYCSVKQDILTDILAIVTGIVLAVTVVYSIKVARILFSNWIELKRRVSDSNLPETRIANPYAAIRIAVFGIYVLLTLCLSFVSIIAPLSPVPDLVSSSIPTAVFVIFGTQADIVRIWVNLIPKFLLPRSLSAWANSSPEASSSSVDHIPQIGSTGSGADIPRTPSNSYDVWKEKFMDPHKSGSGLHAEDAWRIKSFRSSVGSYDSFDDDGEGGQKPLPRLPHQDS